MYGRKSQEVRQYLQILRDSVDLRDTIRSLASGQSERMARGFAEEKLEENGAMEEFGEYNKAVHEIQDLPAQYESKASSLQDGEKLRAEAEKQAVEKAGEILVHNMAKVHSIQKKMGLIKRKYSSLLNSN